MSKTKPLLSKFTSTLLDFIESLAMVCPTSSIASNLFLIKLSINNPLQRTTYIEMFIINVLPHKKKIDNNNEDFFVNKSYEKESGEENMDIVSELKEVWKTLSSGNKEIVFEYMQVLCDHSQNYFNLVY